ncbi:Immunoglobulin superfamily member 10 [Exaiptasia diaphana]|nr:Immunoglobulin superfamily member 10 [Exaiptasia diaphana]
MITTALIFFVVVTCVDSQLCRLKAPSNITEGVWPGTDVLLNCTVFGGTVDRFFWKKDGHVLSNVKLVSPFGQDGRRLLTWEGLKLDNISGRDDGEYRCIVSKDGTTDEDWVTVHIFAKPRITSPKQMYIESNVGNSIVTTCSAEGWPKPTVFWRKEGSNSELSNSFVTNFGVYLHIVFVRKEDNGFYLCYANNSIGTDNRTLLLHVSMQGKDEQIV